MAFSTVASAVLHGVQAEIDGHTVLAGNSKLMKEMNVEYQECTSMGTVVYVALDALQFKIAGCSFRLRRLW